MSETTRGRQVSDTLFASVPDWSILEGGCVSTELSCAVKQFQEKNHVISSLVKGIENSINVKKSQPLEL